VFSFTVEDNDMARSLTAPRSTASPRSARVGPCIRLASARPAPAAHRRAGCALCGSEDVATDEAVDGGLWLLGECGRCGHRWTAGPFDGPTPAPARVRPVPPAREGSGIVAA
jgi:hypothetical protein